MRVFILASVAALVLPASAVGGGWWSFVQTDRATVAAGQRVTAKAVVLFDSAGAARKAARTGRFYAYALRGLDGSFVTRAMSKPYLRDWWSLRAAATVKLGRVALRVSDANLVRARTSFTVPELPLASYALMLCDAGCAHPLADVVPTRGFTVVADPATATLAERTTRLEERASRLHARVKRQDKQLAAAGAAARDARAAVDEDESELGALRERPRVLDGKLVEAATSSRPHLWTSAGWVAAGALAAVTFLLARRRRPKSTGDGLEPWQPSDEELSAFLESQRAREGGVSSRGA